MHRSHRIGGELPHAAAPAGAGRASSTTDERPSPGVAALLDGVREDRSHSVLDLGAASDSGFQLYSRFARRVRFADLIDDCTSAGTLNREESALPAQPQDPYDLVFAWDVLDRLLPEARPQLMRRLMEVTAPDARLHVVMDASENGPTRPLRFTLLDVDRMRCEPSGPPRPERSRMLPAELERVLFPFRVTRAFTLRGGLREYVAVRRPG